jgi:hypothetical protein
MEVPVIEEFLAATGKVGAVVPADKTGEGTLPVESEALQAFEKFAVQQRLVQQSSPPYSYAADA